MYEGEREQVSGNQASPAAVEIDEHKPFVTVARMVNGYYFAALMEWSSVSGSFAIVRSGACRSKKKQKAANEAVHWARREGMDFRL